MFAYVLTRIASVGVILVVMSMLIFGITQALPGNVAYLIAGQFAPPDMVAAIELRLGLNDPIPVQYWRWASGILHGDFGTSMIMERPIGGIVADAIVRSAILAAVTISMVIIVGLGLGVIAAISHKKPLDHGVSIFTYFGISVPEFFWGIVMIIVFSRYLKVLPTGGYEPLAEGFGTWLSHLILPALTLTFVKLAHVSRMTRSSMLEVLQSNYVRNARAKGMTERIVILRHSLRNALLPSITVIAVNIGTTFGGMVVIESVFSYPGIGRLLLFAIERHDIPLIQACILVIAGTFAIANLIADLLYAYFNPKIRYGRQHG